MTRVVIFVLIMVIIPRALLAANQYTESQTLTKEPSPPLAAIELPDLGSEAAKKIEKEDFKEQSESYITNSAAQGFENLTPEALESQAKSYLQNKITSTAQSYIEGLMSPYGVVRTNLSVDQEGSLEGSSLNYFVPLYEDPDNVLFSQLSTQRKEDRTISNIGVGLRHNIGRWMLGGNTFYDYDFSRGHRRLGLGAETWTDFLRFSGNYYHPLSNWKNSPDLDFYEERPARGWDVRVETWLPFYPQVGGKLVYEQYYGDEVALFGEDNLERNPQAVTFELNYTPVPLLTFSTDYKYGTGDNTDVNVTATLNYQFGTPLKALLDPENVKIQHSLEGSRHDFVDRNNFIVLEYREKDPLDVSLFLKADTTNEHPECVISDTPEAGVGLEKCKWTINALVSHHYKIATASWQAKNNANRTLVMPVVKANTLTEGNNNSWNLVLPTWEDAATDAERLALNTWKVRISLVDEEGNHQNSSIVELTVQQHRKIELVVDNLAGADLSQHQHETSAQADGVDGVVMALLLTDAYGDDSDSKGEKLVDDAMMPELYDSNDKMVTLSTKPCTNVTPCVFIANRDKQAGTLTLSSTQPGTFRWKAKTDAYGDSNYVDITFLGQNVNDVNAAIYQTHVGNPVNLIGNKNGHLPLNSAYRFMLWRDKNKDGVFQMSEQLSAEEMAQYDYKWEFTGESISGDSGAQTNTENQDLVLPVTNREAKQKFGASEKSGVQGYGIRVTYHKK